MKNRRNIYLAVAMILGALALSRFSVAQGQAPGLLVHAIKGGVYWTEGGGGGNTGIVIGQNGVIVIDAKTTPGSAKEMLGEIARLSPQPVTTVILTHSDADHVNGLPAFPKGLTIIAQENCKKEMEAALNNPRMPAPRDYLPTKTIDKKESTEINGVHLTLLHFAPAHTSGDLMIYLPDQKIVFGGDMIDVTFPFALIHAQKGGTSEGWIETMKGLISLNADTYVAGHGGLQTKADLQKLLAAVEERRAKIKELVSQGKSLAEVKQAFGETDAPATGPGLHFPSFTEVVYQELAQS